MGGERWQEWAPVEVTVCFGAPLGEARMRRPAGRRGAVYAVKGSESQRQRPKSWCWAGEGKWQLLNRDRCH